MEPTPNKTTPPAETVAWSLTGIRTALVSGIFTLIVLALLVANHFQGKASNPLDNKEMATLKAQLTRTPGNEPLKGQIRELDLRLRNAHFKHVALEQYGAWLLIGGAVVFLASYKPATNRKKLPKPQKRSEADYKKESTQTRLAVILLGLAVGGAGMLLAVKSTTDLKIIPPSKPVAATVAKAPIVEAKAIPAPALKAAPALFPTAEELKRNWPRFRGPFGAGISAYTNIPATWNAKTGENILWSTELPINGPSSPVVWGDRIFLVGANSKKREVYCFDNTGKLLWQKPVDPKREPAEPPTVMEDTGGYAPSTPYVDGRRVYAIFANGDVAAFDFEGNEAWSRNLGRPDNSYGYATSLEMYQNRLLIQFDQGTAKDKKSKILALDSATGETAWTSDPRPVPNSWSTPIVIKDGERDLLITCGNPFVIAHDPANGKELWRAKALYGEVLPSPVYSAGFVYTAMEGEKLSAIPTGGSGDITTNILWTAEDGLPDIVSPLCDGERVYVINSSGLVTCYETKAGKKLWDHDLGETVKSSTSLAGDKLYIIAENGAGFIIAAANEYKEIARTTLGEEILSTPAFADGRLYLRGKKHLFCIGDKGK